MLNAFIGIVPFIVIAYFIYFRKKYNTNNLFVVLIFLSYMIFATNYENYGLNFDLYRYLHKFIGILLSLSLIYHVYKNGVKTLINPISGLILLYLASILFSFIGNDLYMPHYVHYTRNFVFISIIILFLYNKIENKDNLDELFKLILNITLILSVCMLIELFIRGSITRLFLFFPNPNYLAISLMTGFSILLFSQSKFKVLKVLLVISAIYLTGSRAVELGVLFLILIYTFKNRQFISKKYLAAAFLVIFVVMTYFGNIISINTDKSLINVRFAINKIAFNILTENTINGIGYGQFRTKYAKYVDEDIKNMNFGEISMRLVKKEDMMTHNDLLQIVAELGLIGMFFVMFYFYKLFIELKNLFIVNHEYFYISISLIIGSLTFSFFHNNITSFVFWFILFLPFIMNNIYAKDRQST